MNIQMPLPSAPDAHKVIPSMTVSEIVRVFPPAMHVFSNYKIDLCCGGRHPLEMVATKHGLPLEQILCELDAAIEAADRNERAGLRGNRI